LKIGFKNTELLKEKIDTHKIRKLIKEIIHKENRTLGEIEIVFLNDQEILEINREYLGHNYFTDVIAFSYNKKVIISGDILISTGMVKGNAVKYNVFFILELLRVIIHGVLHLIGYNDKDPKEIEFMREKENTYLEIWKEIDL